MRMLIYAVALAHFLVLSVLAQHAKYNVISLVTGDHATGMAVVVDDKPYPMQQDTSSSLLFSASAPHPVNKYHYAKVDSNGNVLESEPFDRNPFEDGSTVNEHYNRTWNTWKISQLPQVLDPLPAIHRIDSKLHIDGEIPTIHITGDEQALQNMHNHYLDDIQVDTTMTYISLHDVQTFSGVEFELSGFGSRQASKVAYNLKLPKKTYLYGYRRLKLRSLATDPSYIREDLGYKMLAAAGVPATDTSYVRVYLNNQPLGLFGFIEKYKDPWLRNEFADGDKNYQQGTLYQGDGIGGADCDHKNLADLGYHFGGKNPTQSFCEYKIAEDPSEGDSDYSALVELTKFLDKAPSTKEAWEAHFDMESVLRGMALEFLLGFADGYLTAAKNYLVYQISPSSSKFMLLLWDIDLILGSTVHTKMSHMKSGDWHNFTSVISKRPLMKFIQVPEYAKRFDQLIHELNDKLMNLDVIGQRIDDTMAMLQEDVAWDKSCPRVTDPYISSDNGIAALQSISVIREKMDGDFKTYKEFMTQRMIHEDVGFIQAVNGPTSYKYTLIGLKEFIKIKHQNVADHYGNKQ